MAGPAPPVECPKCRHSNPSGSLHCTQCSAPLSSEDLTLTEVDLSATEVMGDAWSRVEPTAGTGVMPKLGPGRVIANRYEILQLLGEGGMGAVFKAMDRQLERAVALKIIRPELAGNATILRRFKQELLLARQVTHRNVIRIFDLGVADGLHFITMDYVQGRDLNALMEERKFTPEETVKIIRQVAEALDAAHSESVIHRDLKPHNIMLTEAGKVCVMDFGLARSVEASGLTRTGALLGTPTYMSPEQAKGIAVDTRSDLFSLGVLFYEMLVGDIPFKADTVLGMLLKRTQETAVPPAELNPAIPAVLSDVVMRCLAIDPAQRYQTAREVLQDLNAFQPEKRASTSEIKSRSLVGAKGIVTPRFNLMSESSAWKWISASLAVTIVVLAGAFVAFRFLNRPAAPVAPMTVLIADFNNHTGDPVFSGTLESTLKRALEGASFVSAYDRTTLKDVGLQANPDALDESKAQAIASSQGLNVVVAGALDRRGSDYQLSLHAIHTVTGKVIANADEKASSKDQVLFAVTKLGTAVRKALGDSTSESAQRLSMETLSAASLEAVHEYAAGVDVMSKGQTEEAIKHLSQAVDLDPNFGTAYTAMASAFHNNGRDQDALKYIREALNHIDHMTERERFHTRGYLYSLTNDYQKCIDEYGALLERYPSDTSAYTNVASCYGSLRNLPKAVEVLRRAASILPKRAIYHSNLGFYLARSGDFQGAAKEAAETLKLNFALGGLLGQAFASLGQEQAPQAAEAYHQLEKTSPSRAATGLADLSVYEGSYQEAVKILEKGAKEDMGARKPAADAAARKLSALAYVQVLRGQSGPALEAVKSALELNTNNAIEIRFVAGRIYAALGETAKARELAAGLSKENQVEPQSYGKLIEGEIALKSGDGGGAVTLFTDGKNLLDTWIARFDLGRAYLETKAFAQADSEFDRCIKRRGEALTLFFDPVPTYGYFPEVYYYQGRAREGMRTAGFAESFKKYVSIRGKAGEDPLLGEARRRGGA